MDFLVGIDSEWFLYLNSMRSGFGDIFFEMFSGRWVWIPMYAVMVYVLFRDFKWQQAVVFVLGVALTILLADQICSHLMRPLVQRPRPSSVASPIVHLAHFSGNMRSATSYGFPSCHAANTMALAMLFSLYLKRWALTIFLFLWALVTCWSRIYLAAHYPGDLFIGAVVGIAVAAVVFAACSYFARMWTGNAYKNREVKARINIAGQRVSLYPSYLVIATGVLTIIYMAILGI